MEYTKLNNTTSHKSKRWSLQYQSKQFNMAALIIIIAVFIAIGVYFVLFSRAAGNSSAINASQGTVAPPASIMADNSAAGGSLVHFMANTQTGSRAARGMWVWDTTVVQDNISEQSLFNFAKAHNVTTLFLFSESLLPNNPTLLAKVINDAAAQNISVELLFGEPEWTLTPNHAAAINFTTLANKFSAGLSSAKPKGVHYDVEPGSLPQWTSDPNGTANQLLDLLVAIEAAKSNSLQFSFDYQMAADVTNVTRNGVTKPLTKWVIDSVDRGVLMSYRDHAAPADGIIDHADMSVAYAGSVGKQVALSVETTCGLIPTKITFCEEGSSYLDNELAKVIINYKNSPGFANMDIHDYAAYKILKP